MPGPRGRLSTRARPFEQVVQDLRHVVHAVVRSRPRPDGKFDATALGSGFFVSRTVFLTCCHVVNGLTAPHVDGDSYLLVRNLGESLGIHEISKAVAGKNVHLYPDCDLALFVYDGGEQHAFPALDYGYVREGRGIGVAGYPLPTLSVINDALVFNGLIYRVARGEVTARYNTNVTTTGLAEPVTGVPAIEVNFLFVPGNSGGPIFDAEHGQILGFVHGFRDFKVKESVATVSLIPDLPEGVPRTYIENVSGIYSLGIKLDRVRARLEEFNVLP